VQVLEVKAPLTLVALTTNLKYNKANPETLRVGFIVSSRRAASKDGLLQKTGCFKKTFFILEETACSDFPLSARSTHRELRPCVVNLASKISDDSTFDPISSKSISIWVKMLFLIDLDFYFPQNDTSVTTRPSKRRVFFNSGIQNLLCRF